MFPARIPKDEETPEDARVVGEDKDWKYIVPADPEPPRKDG